MAFYRTTKIRTYRNPAEILELVRDFEQCTLPVSEFNNETYLTLAFWYLYLNPLSQAQSSMSESIARYCFENNLNANECEHFEQAKMPGLLRAMNDFIKLYKGKKPFAALANLVLIRFTDQNLQLKNYRRARTFFPDALVRPITFEESR